MKNPLTKDRLIHGLVLKTGLSLKDAEVVAKETMHLIRTALETGEGVHLVGLFTMNVVERKGRENYNPHTKQIEVIGPKKIVRFKLSKSVKL